MASDQYWEQRALADERRASEIAGRASVEISKMYKKQYRKLIEKLDALLARIDRGQALSRTDLWNYAQWKALEAQLRGMVDAATRAETERVTRALDEVFEETMGAPIEGFTIDRSQLNTDPLNVVDLNWSGTNYSSRIWTNNARLAQSLSDSMEDMIVSGRDPVEIKKSIMKSFNVAWKDADRLVRTEAAYVLNRANVERCRRIGLKKIKWSAVTESGKTCAICRAYDGKVWVIGTELRMPAHPRCRCVYVGVVELTGEDVPVTGPKAEEDAAVKAGNLPRSSKPQTTAAVPRAEKPKKPETVEERVERMRREAKELDAKLRAERARAGIKPTNTGVIVREIKRVTGG